MLVDKDDHALGSKVALVREALVTEAHHGSRLAHDALCYAATVLINRGKDLPPWLGRYFVSLAAEDKAPSKRGRKPQTKSLRDTAIAWTVGKVAISYGLEPTRSPATKEKGTVESGCSIVQKALAELGIDMEEDNVNAIWGHAGPHDATRSALMEAAIAANALRRDFWRLFASRPRGMGGDGEWLKEHDPREAAHAWRRTDAGRRSPRARRGRKKVRPPAC
jgi:hypothetical protein